MFTIQTTNEMTAAEIKAACELDNAYFPYPLSGRGETAERIIQHDALMRSLYEDAFNGSGDLIVQAEMAESSEDEEAEPSAEELAEAEASRAEAEAEVAAWYAAHPEAKRPVYDTGNWAQNQLDYARVDLMQEARRQIIEALYARGSGLLG